MLSPYEAIGFQKCVMDSFDNSEFVKNWETLRKRSLHGKKSMELFISDVRDIVWSRLPIKIRQEMCK